MRFPHPPSTGPGPHTDALDEYGGDYRRFEALDPQTAAAVLRRRETKPAVEKGASPKDDAPPPGAAARPSSPPTAEGPIQITSRGRTLIVGREPTEVAACGLRLAEHQPCLMLVEESPLQNEPTAPRAAVQYTGAYSNGLLWGKDIHISGGLGDFQAFTRVKDRLVPLGRTFDGLPDRLDLVLDLRPPGPEGRISPPGYYAPDGDPDRLDAILKEMPQMVGHFSKPRFVRSDAPACAGPEACGRCREVCPTAAVAIVDGAVAIDHNACPGCGLCTVVCPTGALQYRQPSPQDLLAVVHARLADTRLASGAAPTVIFRQVSVGEDAPAPFDADPDDAVLTVPLESVGCVGPEVWMSTLAFGARQVVIALPEACPACLQRALAGEHAWAEALLTEMGFDRRRLHLRAAGAPEERLPMAEADAIPAADFMPFHSKRDLIRRSAAHLAARVEAPQAASLPEGAPFGAVVVDSAACTLCMACSGACPTGALTAAGASPALRFLESECMQCGRCRDTCPEQALGLVPRLGWDPERIAQPRTLWSEAPTACLRCGRPFAPPGLLAKIQSRLADHWLYQREEDRRRLFMCRDCRVRDIFSPASEETS